jgi:hypothetical protein
MALISLETVLLTKLFVSFLMPKNKAVARPGDGFILDALRYSVRMVEFAP